MTGPLTSALTAPLTGPLCGEAVLAYDADSEAWLDLVAAAGGTVTGAHRAIASARFVAEKAAGRWGTVLKRLYLPIWGVAAANAIDLVTRASGTWIGGVTHAAGWVQSNGTTGYFQTPENQNVLWASPNSNGLFFGSYEVNTISGLSGYVGHRDGAGNGVQLWHVDDANLAYDSAHHTFRAGVATPKQAGIFIASRVGTGVHFGRRMGGSYTALANVTTATGGTLPALPVYALRNHGFYSNDKRAFFGIVEGANAAACEAITATLETLWEGLTGLTLP